MTSEHLALGDRDADSRWIGIRRHQAVLSVVGLGTIGDWILRSRRSPIELVVGAVLVACAAPTGEGLTAGELLSVGVSFLFRSHWRTYRIDSDGSADVVHSRRSVAIQGFELQHRGRLDLSGGDVVNAGRLAEMAIALSVRGEPSHVSLHVFDVGQGATTLMTLGGARHACEGWTPRPGLVKAAVGMKGSSNTMHVLERWNYLRCGGEVLRVLRVIDFTAAPSGRAVLERLQGRAHDRWIALHFDVVSGAKAQRISGRAVHRMGSDGVATRAVGFRRSARTARLVDRVAQREQLVANGEALLRIATFIVVRARTLGELHLHVKAAVRAGEESGLRIERGAGRQAAWYEFQLPGGPDW